jgi:hypothetical protein
MPVTLEVVRVDLSATKSSLYNVASYPSESHGFCQEVSMHRTCRRFSSRIEVASGAVLN